MKAQGFLIRFLHYIDPAEGLCLAKLTLEAFAGRGGWANKNLQSVGCCADAAADRPPLRAPGTQGLAGFIGFIGLRYKVIEVLRRIPKQAKP